MDDSARQKERIGRFDQVRLLTTRNVSYLSAPPGTEIVPSGIWSVVAVTGDNELLCARNSVIIRIPAADVLKVADYSVDHITKNFGKLSHGKEQGTDRSG